MAIEPVVHRLAGGTHHRAGEQHAQRDQGPALVQFWPEATTPQAKAHMGGNQVIGLSSSATADGAG
jgi:hypothetical protein